MTDERAIEDIVTKFLLNTCRLRPHYSEPALQAAVRHVWFARNYTLATTRKQTSFR